MVRPEKREKLRGVAKSIRGGRQRDRSLYVTWKRERGSGRPAPRQEGESNRGGSLNTNSGAEKSFGDGTASERDEPKFSYGERGRELNMSQKQEE